MRGTEVEGEGDLEGPFSARYAKDNSGSGEQEPGEEVILLPFEILIICSWVWSLLLLLVDVIMEKFDNQVDVSQDHAAAAVAFAAKLVEGLRSWHTFFVD